MKKIALSLMLLLVIPLSFAIHDETPKPEETLDFDLVEIANILNEEQIEIPKPFSNFVTDEKINIYIDEDVLTITLEDDVLTKAGNTPLLDPSIEVYTTHKTINALYYKEMKASEALKTKAIDIKGIGIWNGLKVGFLKIGLRIAANRIDDMLEDETVGERIRDEKKEQPKDEKPESQPSEYIGCWIYGGVGCGEGECPEGKECVKFYDKITQSDNCTCKKVEDTIDYTCAKKTPPNCNLGTCKTGTCAEYNSSYDNETICSCRPYERWVDANCTDTDSGQKPNTKGKVYGWTKDSNEVKTDFKIWDVCNGAKTQVNEKWCYDNPEGTGQIHGTMVFDCDNGCNDGACI